MKTRKKLIIVLGIILILVSGFVCKETSHASTDDEMLLACFETSKADIEISMLFGWASVENVFMDEGQLNSKLDAIAEGLGFDENKTKKSVEVNADMNRAELTSRRGPGLYKIVIESMRNDDKSQASYCYFTAKNDGEYSSLIKDKVLAERILTNARFPMKLDILLIGSYEGKMTKEQCEAIVDNLFDKIEARRVESLKSGDIISISAYSSQLTGHIRSKGRKINLQAAMRYSEYDDKTYLWIGYPVIDFEY